LYVDFFYDTKSLILFNGKLINAEANTK